MKKIAVDTASILNSASIQLSLCSTFSLSFVLYFLHSDSSLIHAVSTGGKTSEEYVVELPLSVVHSHANGARAGGRSVGS